MAKLPLEEATKLRATAQHVAKQHTSKVKDQWAKE